MTMIEAAHRELASGDIASAMRLVRQNWLRLILESRTSELEELCVAFPDQHDPHLLLIRACCRDLAGDPHGATFLRGQGLRVASDDFVVCFTNLLLAPDSSTKSAIADAAGEALRQCGPDDDYPAALFLLGWAEVRLRRNLSRAISLLRSAVAEARLQARDDVLRLAQSNLAFALTHAGAFSEAERILDTLSTATTATDWERFEGGLPQSNQGTIAFWRGEFDAAVAHLRPIIAEEGPGTDFEAQARLYLIMSVIALQREDRYRDAAQLLRGVSTEDKHGVPWGTLRAVVAAWLAHAEGHDDLARKLGTGALARPGAPVAHALLAALFERMEEFDLAGQALRIATATELPRYARISALVTTAAVSSVSGQGALAHEHLDRALEEAADDQVLAPFLLPGALVGDLLTAHTARGSRHDALLRAIFARRDALSHSVTGVLTVREREVMTQLRTARTAEEIAAELQIAYPTVKTHIRSIYRKLGVTTRRAAVRLVDTR